MLKNFIYKIINSWKFFVFLILFPNFVFLLNADLILIVVLIGLFCFILVFSSFELKDFVKKEKMEILKKFFLIIEDIRRNFLFLNKFYIFNSYLLNFFISSLNFWFANNLIYRCLEFSRNINYFFIFIFEILSFSFYFQKKPFSIDDFRQNFFSF